MIRPATADDIIPIVDMCEALSGAIDCAQKVDRSHVASVISRMIVSPLGVVLRSDNGFIGGQLASTFCRPEPVAIEMGWWAGDGSGLRLLRAFEKWAEDQGAARIILSTGPTGPDLTRLGYRRAETAWVRSI